MSLTAQPTACKQLNVGRLPAQQAEYFQREIEILLKCHDPFLLQMYGFPVEPQFGIVTMFMEGGALWDFLRKNPGALTPVRHSNIADGMKCLHQHETVHRDLESGNILLDRNLLPYVAGFGLGWFVEGAAQEVTQAAGTVQWMVAEQIFTKNYGLFADVYAYGIVLYKVLTE
jgi:serine/threonine protein kinase